MFVDVAFKKYSYKALSSSRQEIECIDRSPTSILQELIISKDDVQIVTLNSSGVVSSTDDRYSTNNQEYDGEVRLTLSIPSVECQDQGRYKCKLITTNNETIVSSEMSFIVEGNLFYTSNTIPVIFYTIVKRQNSFMIFVIKSCYIVKLIQKMECIIFNGFVLKSGILLSAYEPLTLCFL